MIRLRCSSCNEEVEVPSLLAATKTACTSCGQTVMGGLAAPAAEDTGPPRWDYVRGVDAQGRLKMAESESAGITVLGLFIMVVGVLGFLFSVAAALLAPLIFETNSLRYFVGEKPLPPPDPLSDAVDPGTPLLFYLIFLGAAVLAVLFVASGNGVLRRRQWGRILAVGTSGLLFLCALGIAISGGNVILLVTFFALFGVTSYFLLTEDATREFANPNAWRFP